MQHKVALFQKHEKQILQSKDSKQSFKTKQLLAPESGIRHESIFVVIKINAIYSFKNRFQLDKVETGL